MPEAPPSAVSTRGEASGMVFLERLTGGAQAGDAVPMIVVLHPMGGDPASMLEIFSQYPKPARLVLPYGHPSGGAYVWFNTAASDIKERVVRREAERIAALIAALTQTRATLGKPIVTGFSQGGFLSFALAITHPELLSAAFPIGGLLPPALYPSAALASTPRPSAYPSVLAFHGAADMTVPIAGARASIAELRTVGYQAELREYPGIAHTISSEELRDVIAGLVRVADRQLVLSR